MGDFAKLPSKKKLEGTFYDYSGGKKTIDLEGFKHLCYKFYLAPTTKAAAELFTQLDKNSDSLLSFDEVVALMEKQWTPINERKVSFLEDLRKCRKKTGPIDREELREILQQNSEEALTDEDVDYCFDKLDINRDKEISEEEICELIFKVEDMMSREPSRTEMKSEKKEKHKSKKSRSRSSSSSSDRSGKGSRKGSAHKKDMTEDETDIQEDSTPQLQQMHEVILKTEIAIEQQSEEDDMDNMNAKITAPSGDDPSNFQDMAPIISGPAMNIYKNPLTTAEPGEAEDDEEAGIEDDEEAGVEVDEEAGLEDDEEAGVEDDERAGEEDDERAGEEDGANEEPKTKKEKRKET